MAGEMYFNLQIRY